MRSTTLYKCGDIVLVSFPFTDLSAAKVICIGYLYKPSRRQMDEVVAAVKELGPRVPRLNVSLSYEFAVERALREYRNAPMVFEQNVIEYLSGRMRH